MCWVGSDLGEMSSVGITNEGKEMSSAGTGSAT